MSFLWNIWPMKNYAAITLPWGIYYNPNVKVSDALKRHELIHIFQQKRIGKLRFYIQYVFEYFVNLCKYRNHMLAYRNISFEVEAYAKMNDVSIKV